MSNGQVIAFPSIFGRHIEVNYELLLAKNNFSSKLAEQEECVNKLGKVVIYFTLRNASLLVLR